MTTVLSTDRKTTIEAILYPPEGPDGYYILQLARLVGPNVERFVVRVGPHGVYIGPVNIGPKN